jgi:hypothetical protein
MRRTLLMLLFGGLGMLAVAEAGLRVYGPYFAPLVGPDPDVELLFLRDMQTVRYSGESGHLVHIRTNESGVRDRAWLPLDGGRRILVLGDSYVAALQVEARERFTERLEAMYRSEGRAVRVLNAGIPGQDPVKYLNYMRRFARIAKPDQVVVTLANVDEFSRAGGAFVSAEGRTEFTVEGDRVVERNTPFDPAELRMKALREMVRGLWLVRVAREGVERLGAFFGALGSGAVPRPGAAQCPYYLQPDNPELLAAFRVTAQVLQMMNTEMGGRLTVLQAPSPAQLSTRQATPDCDPELPERWFRQMADRSGIALVQLLPAFRSLGPQAYIGGNGHLSPAGHLAAAAALQAALALGPVSAALTGAPLAAARGGAQ